jgi:hypothetical protein
MYSLISEPTPLEAEPAHPTVVEPYVAEPTPVDLEPYVTLTQDTQVKTSCRPTNAIDAEHSEHKKRKYLPSWKDTYTWLSYDPALDVATCRVCIEAEQLQLLKSDKRRDDAFLSRGFKNWSKGPEKCAKHETSLCHRESVGNLATLASVPRIDAKVNKLRADEQQKAREALTVIFTSLRFLAKQNIAIRGHSHDSGNFIELLKLRCEDSPSLSSWIEKRDNWTSDTIQNEILQMLAHDVQRQIVADIDKSPYIGIIADGTTDEDGKEQFSVSVRYLDIEHFVVHDAFLGFYNPTSSTADVLTAAIVDVLQRLAIPINKLRGHSFDGASNMSGRVHGVQAQLTEMQPKSVYVHCVNHSLDLALQEVACEVPLIRDSLVLVKDCANVFRESAKRKQKLKTIADDIAVNDNTDADSVTLLALCPTRWCVRAKAIKRMLSLWKVVVLGLDELSVEAGRGEIKSKMVGLRKQMAKMKTYQGVVICEALFGPCEDLATALQSEKTTATGSVQAANVLLSHLKKLRNEDEFNYLFSQAEIDFKNIGLLTPTEADDEKKRATKKPARYEQQLNTSCQHVFTDKDKMRSEYYAALDLFVSEIERRFDQPGLKHMAALESLLSTRAINEDELHAIIDVYDDLDPERMLREIRMLPDLIETTGTDTVGTPLPKTIHEWAGFFSAQPPTVRDLFRETIKVVQLILVVPATAASAERSFSSLRRIKTWLRRTMTQKRVTHLAVLHCHQERLASCSIPKLCKEFALKTYERRSTFGY